MMPDISNMILLFMLLKYLCLLQACCMLQLLKYIQKMLDKELRVGDELSLLFAGELNPVAPKAQRKVPVPEG